MHLSISLSCLSIILPYVRQSIFLIPDNKEYMSVEFQETLCALILWRLVCDYKQENLVS